MKKKIISILAAASVLLSVGCSDSDYESEEHADTAEVTTVAETSDDAEEAEPADDNSDTEAEETSDDAVQAVTKGIKGFSLSVNSSDGKMNITRAPKKSTPMGDPDTWTIFIYLCGTDLEDNIAAATLDIVQMAQAQTSDNVRFVFQTGGTETWQIESMDPNACERYVVEDNDIRLVDSAPLTNMGDPSTLESFLEWGVSAYPAEKMGFIFWDHGGGSITGACVDELHERDTLSLAEINSAFSDVYENMTDKFEFIGFDCCLMGTAETANVLATYSRYFYGSQESEPGSGWDYTAIGNFLAEDPSANGADLGKVVTDSFYDECAAADQESGCTFTIIDCEKFDDFAIAFNDYAKDLYTAAASDLGGIVRGVNEADNFGGNDKSEGYTNMVDIGGIINNCASYADGSKVLAALDDCIVYNKNGTNHTGASGLSIYYPLSVEGSEELKIFSGICISPYYLSLVDMVAKGYTGNGYDEQVFFTEDGGWSNDDCEGNYDTYFDDESYGESSESSLITFAQEPHLDENGIYTFTLDEQGYEYAAGVTAYIYLGIDEENVVELGETDDVYVDWETGTFADNFDGYWLALPDGQILPTYIVDSTEEYTVFTSPIMLNGDRTNLRVRVYTDYTVVVEGAWDGIDENGMAAREIKKISAGDTIVPVYYLLDESDFSGEEYSWQDGDNIAYDYLPSADYYYGFGIDDVYGDYYISDFVVFSIDEEGNISFDQN